MEKKKIGLFFGAGAEISYGLPTGGKFALDIFRIDTGKYKKELESVVKNIEKGSNYATGWLPDGYYNKRILGFGKNDFTTIIESSLEYRKDLIIKLLNDFDTLFIQSLKKLSINKIELNEKFKEQTNKSIGDIIYSQLVKLNSVISTDIKLFDSEYYSAILELIKSESNQTQIYDLKRFASSFLQLLVASYGSDLIQKLNQEIFTEAPNDIPIFDDVAGIFKIEYSNAGLSALDIILKEKKDYTITENSNCIEIFTYVTYQTLEDLFASILDYQSLIDSHYRYLFSPKNEWAKFTKMVIFLQIVRDYIKNQCVISDMELENRKGYYHELMSFKLFNIDISVIGTSNYNNLVERIYKIQNEECPAIFHLNGSINDFYDPFKNKLITIQDDSQIPNDLITVPFIFTQSGLKPLTSIDMSKRYVELFDKFNDSDSIIVIGFGFNVDDSHINGLFRELVEEYEKKIIIVLNNNWDIENKRKEILKKLRLTKNKHLVELLAIDKETRLVDDMLWVNKIVEMIN